MASKAFGKRAGSPAYDQVLCNCVRVRVVFAIELNNFLKTLVNLHVTDICQVKITKINEISTKYEIGNLENILDHLCCTYTSKRRSLYIFI